MKRFNITGQCIPERDYMADTSRMLEQIGAMVEKGDYFTINRARQYGKTTTLTLLERELRSSYIVLRISFESLGESAFANESNFVRAFSTLCMNKIQLQILNTERYTR